MLYGQKGHVANLDACQELARSEYYGGEVNREGALTLLGGDYGGLSLGGATSQLTWKHALAEVPRFVKHLLPERCYGRVA